MPAERDDVTIVQRVLHKRDLPLVQSAKLNGFWGLLDTWVLRWLAPAGTSAIMILTLFLDVDIEMLRKRYPSWPGMFDLLEGFPLYRALFISAIIALLGAGYNVIRAKRMDRLLEDNSRLHDEVGAVAENIHALFEAVLLSLANKLEVDERGTERVSIYVHRPETNTFVPCGRFSHNPKIKKKGRTSFPDDQGCIAKAWEEDWHFCADFPEPSRSGPYVDYLLHNYGIPRDVGRSLKMKPKLIAAKRISLNGSGVAIIVFESTDKGKFTEDQLKGRLTAASVEYGQMIKSIQKYIPNPRRAAEVGL